MRNSILVRVLYHESNTSTGKGKAMTPEEVQKLADTLVESAHLIKARRSIQPQITSLQKELSRIDDELSAKKEIFFAKINELGVFQPGPNYKEEVFNSLIEINLFFMNAEGTNQ